MTKKKLNKKKWVVLFGGAGRESIIFHLIKNNIKISQIFIPSKINLKLLNAINNIKKKTNIKIKKIQIDNLQKELKGDNSHVLFSIGFSYKIDKNVIKN